ncbi:MAG: hypothetical protein GWM88_08360 [Pseudomonadales bacterium]|nr:hypothetical protein [Pseudomonadales bacterium]NIX08016.1 hypothetical protein [Pseudomonadales bacterium]
MPVFPSADWFQAVREVYNGDSTLHSGGGGACDTTAGFLVGKRGYLIVFEGLECADVREAAAGELDDVDFVISMSEVQWRDMVANVQEHGRADLDHTLNSIDLSQEESIAFSPVDDQYRQDLFYRYNQNFQDFFDASSRVETTFE